MEAFLKCCEAFFAMSLWLLYNLLPRRFFDPSPSLNRKYMKFEFEGGVLDIHFGNKTDVHICRICLVEKNTSDHCKKNSSVISSGLLAWV
jgi:hypothetical protein